MEGTEKMEVTEAWVASILPPHGFWPTRLTRCSVGASRHRAHLPFDLVTRSHCHAGCRDRIENWQFFFGPLRMILGIWKNTTDSTNVQRNSLPEHAASSATVRPDLERTEHVSKLQRNLATNRDQLVNMLNEMQGRGLKIDLVARGIFAPRCRVTCVLADTAG